MTTRLTLVLFSALPRRHGGARRLVTRLTLYAILPVVSDR